MAITVPASALSSLLRVRLGERPLEDVLLDLARVAQEAVSGTDDVSVTLLRGDRSFTAAHTGPMALEADQMQYEWGYGPCIDAAISGQAQRVDDMRTEDRWPDYTCRVVEAGVLGSLSVALPLQTQVLGALNMYSRRPGAFASEEAEAVAAELSGYLAVSTANALIHADAAREVEQMRAAMATRAVIEQAIGIVMATERCDPGNAFGVLRRASQGRNVKLRDVAAELVTRVASGR